MSDATAPGIGSWIGRAVRSILIVAAAALMLVVVAGCASRGERPRVLVLGFDGLDPAAVDLLMSEGKLPNFARLRQQGAYAPLKSSRPLLSPVLWTTIATGRTPDQHRIGHFLAVNPKTGQDLPVTSRMRRVKALWNIASDAGKRVEVVGWWATWPSEAISGSLVSDHLCYHFLMEEGSAPAKTEAGLTHPPELLARIAPLVRRPSDLTLRDLDPFIEASPEDLTRPFDFDDDVSHFKWALATAESYRRIGLELWRQDRPDIALIYVEGTDSTSHLFGHLFRAGALSGELAVQQRRFGRAVEEMYMYADRFLGEYVEAMDANTTLVVLSDHGFELGVLQDDPSKTRDMRRVSEQYHTMHGILYLYGRNVRARARLEEPAILDITPTVLALAGIPPARDMAGRVLIEGLLLPEPERIATYETGAVASKDDTVHDASVDQEILERLGSLGYLQATSPSGERNLAGVLFESGRYEEAAKEYARLVADKPDDGTLRTSYAGALGALGRYDEAMRELDRAIALEPLNPEAHHNRAVILERRGDLQGAIREYRTAVRYNPQYEASRQALERLVGRPDVVGPSSAAERLAFKILSQASGAARRGDYEEAMSKLDEAEKIAPRYALVYQYRSNVAYLMGDREAAEAALRKGLEIEPDNALFRENLKNLANEPPRSGRR